MNSFLIRLSRLVFGLVLFSIGIVMTIQANIGYAPWDVFHAGLSKVSGLSFGTVSILVGLFFLVIVMIMGEKFGLGTVLNMVIIGALIDFFLGTGWIPKMQHWYSSYPFLLLGLLIIAFGSYFYIQSGFGAGPRDSLMLALTKKTGVPIGVCRVVIELLVLGAGWLLGGMVGLGTVIAAFAVGVFVQLVFRLLRFDSSSVQHESLWQTLGRLRPSVAPAE